MILHESARVKARRRLGPSSEIDEDIPADAFALDVPNRDPPRP